VITIVNKLNLIKKHHFRSISESFSEDHINLKIREILSTTDSKKRSDNSNISKFIKIVEFEDREGLTKELGKLLRLAWAKEKESGSQPQVYEPASPQRPEESVK
jgi:hypothetical protein